MDFSIAGIVRHQAAVRGDQEAVTQGGRTVTYGVLDERSSGVARGLADAGVRPGDRVAYLARNDVAYFELLLGAAKLGAVTVGVNWRLAAGEVAGILADARARVLVADPELRPGLDDAIAGLPDLRLVLLRGGEDPDRAFDAWVAAHAGADPGRVARPDDVVLQLYTSGTTGTPKGALLTEGNLGTLLPNLAPTWGFDAASLSVLAMPVFHIGGAGWGLLGMWSGGRAELFRDFDPHAIVATFGRRPVTNGLFVPAMLQALCAVPGVEDVDVGAVRSIVYGAAPITPGALTRALEVFGCPFIGSYGITETCGPISQLDAADHDPVGRPELLPSVGRAFPWVEIEVVDADGVPLPAGETGEVRVRSGQVMRGYWERPEATAEVLDPDGWFRTGDAGRLDAEGRLFLTDRVKDMVITGGENVYPVEVENVLGAHPAVADVAVFGVPDERWGEAVRAAVVPAAGTRPTAEELVAFCRERLARFKCPSAVDLMDDLPRTPSGKVLRRELRAPFLAAAATDGQPGDAGGGRAASVRAEHPPPAEA